MTRYLRGRRAGTAMRSHSATARRTVYFAQPPAGVNGAGGRRDRPLVRPSTVVIYPTAGS